METSLFSTQFLFTTYMKQADSLSRRRPAFLFYTVAVYNSYREGRVSARMETSCSSNTAAVYNPYREGRVSVRKEASIYFLYS